MEPSVAALFMYPIKSCRGIQVESAPISSTGFAWDRQWMVVNEQGRAITQRQEPTLALVETTLPQIALKNAFSLSSSGLSLGIKAPGMELLQIPLSTSHLCKRVNASVWEWSGEALEEGSMASIWFSKYLGKPARLVRFDKDSTRRATNIAYANGYQTCFADGYPFLLVSQASMDALNNLLPNEFNINRFRAKYACCYFDSRVALINSILVKGCEAFAEDVWHTFKIGGLLFLGVKLCDRCKVPTIDQATGEAGDEPLLALRKFRKGEQISENVKKSKSAVYFGQNIVCKETLQLLNGDWPLVSVGDSIQVLEKFESLPM